MKNKDIKGMSKTDRYLVDAQVESMMKSLTEDSLKGLYSTLCTLGEERISINKRFQGILFNEIYLLNGKVYASYVVDDMVRQSLLETFQPWLIVRIAIKVYNAWQGLVNRGALEAPPNLPGREDFDIAC